MSIRQEQARTQGGMAWCSLPCEAASQTTLCGRRVEPWQAEELGGCVPISVWHAADQLMPHGSGSMNLTNNGAGEPDQTMAYANENKNMVVVSQVGMCARHACAGLLYQKQWARRACGHWQCVDLKLWHRQTTWPLLLLVLMNSASFLSLCLSDEHAAVCCVSFLALGK